MQTKFKPIPGWILLPTVAVVSIVTLTAIVGANSHVSAADIRDHSEESDYTVDETINDDLYVAANESVTVEKDVRGDLFVASGDVRVSGDVLGNAYVAGGNIVIEGKINGDLFVAGGQIDVKDDIGRNLYVAGGNIQVRGAVSEDVFASGGQIELEGGVYDDVRATGGVIRIEQATGGDLLVSGGTLTVEGDVDGDVYISAGTATINSRYIGGDLVFYGNENSLKISKETEIAGKKTVEELPVVAPVTNTQDTITVFTKGLFSIQVWLVWNTISLIGTIALGLFLLKAMPVKIYRTYERMNQTGEVGSSFVIGLLAVPVSIIIGLLLLVSVIGIPILGFLATVAALAKMLTVPIVGLTLGRKLVSTFSEEDHPNLAMIIGVLLLSLLKLIPFVGVIVSIIVFCVGIGALIRMKWKVYRGEGIQPDVKTSQETAITPAKKIKKPARKSTKKRK